MNFPHHNILAQASFLPRSATFLLNIFLMSSMGEDAPWTLCQPHLYGPSRSSCGIRQSVDQQDCYQSVGSIKGQGINEEVLWEKTNHLT